MPDAETHPQPCVQKGRCMRTQFVQVRRTFRHSLRNGLRLIARSPQCPGFSSHRRLLIIIGKLDPSIGGSGPHAFARPSRRASSLRTKPSIASRSQRP